MASRREKGRETGDSLCLFASSEDKFAVELDVVHFQVRDYVTDRLSTKDMRVARPRRM